MSTESAPPLPAWRRLPIGAEPSPDGGVHHRVWAPGHRSVEVVLESAGGRATPLQAEGNGYFSGLVAEAAAGGTYRLRLDGGECLPDPASRFQPEGPHGPSQVVDPAAYRWGDSAWRGVSLEGQVLYELHVGTFTREGTYAAAAEQLPALADLGVTLIEMMPVAEFPGRFGWGYDGVNPFAPTRLYGTPDDLRRFVDRAHQLGLGVILDVVYNHLGPDGNYLKRFSDGYFSKTHVTEWGEAFNVDGPDCKPVRDYLVCNAGYWVDEFHMDGLRLDATQSVFDDSPRHVLADISTRVQEAARGRGTFVVGENEPQQIAMLRTPEEGGCGLDALWNDDFHHAAAVALTGRDEAYYTDYRGAPQEFVSAAKHGFLYQGQPYKWQRKPRGTPTRGMAAARLVVFLENHDQLANSASGQRLHRLASPARLRAMTTLLLLGPQTPMLFQGQEFAASAPFLYFADHQAELARLVRNGRAEFLSQFPSIDTPELRSRLASPDDPATFERCKLDHGERERHRDAVALHRDLLRLRRDDPVIAAQGRHGIDGAVLGASAFLIRFLAPDGDDRLLLVNLGTTLHLEPAPEPLLAPPEGCRWQTRFHSEAPEYGGLGMAPLLFAPALAHQRTAEERREASRTADESPHWRIPGECAVLLVPGSLDDAR